MRLVLAHEVVGSGQPLVLVHGIGSDRRRWGTIVDRLAQDHTCITLDLPGHGDSPALGCDALSAASAVHDLVEYLGIAEPVVVGHSLGATVALLYGALYPSLALVAIDPVGLHTPHLAAGLAPFRERLQGDDFAAAFLEWEERFRLDLVREPLQSELRTATHPDQDVVLSYWRIALDPEASAAVQASFADALAAIQVPVLMYLAEPPTAEDQVILDRMGTTTVELSEHGHYLHLVDPPTFCARLRDFVQAARASR